MKLTDDELSALICACQAADSHGAREPWGRCGGTVMRKLVREEASRVKSVAPAEYQPDHAVPPGETIKEMMVDRDMSYVQLAAGLGEATDTVSDLIQGKREITSSLAILLGGIFDFCPSYWINLELNYRRNLARLT